MNKGKRFLKDLKKYKILLLMRVCEKFSVNRY